MGGPVSAAGLGAAAAYATLREDSAGQVARKVGALGLDATGSAVDRGLKATDSALEALVEGIEGGSSGSVALPPPVQAWMMNNKDTCKQVSAACGALQEVLPRKALR